MEDRGRGAARNRGVLNMAVKRVLMVHNYYQQGGGEHTVFENEARLLRENGCEVITYTKDNKELKRKPWRLLFLPFTTIWSFKTYHEVRRLIREHHIEVVHCHNTFPQISPSVYYAAWSCSVPVVQTIHNFRFVCPNGLCFRDGAVCEDCLKQGLRCSLRHRCYRGSLLQTLPVAAMLWLHRKVGTYKRLNYIFLSDFNKRKIESQLAINGRTWVKPNFSYIEPAQATTAQQDQFIFVGRLDENKGVHFMLDAFGQHPEWKLHIYGDGALKPEVESAAKERKNILYHGFCPQQKIRAAWASSAAMIFPSLWYEGFPMSITESFALGVPVICAELGNQGELVEEGKNGAKYQLGKLEEFERAIRRVQERQEDLHKGALITSKRYSSHKNVRQLFTIYEELRG